jgi:hypothetical protein
MWPPALCIGQAAVVTPPTVACVRDVKAAAATPIAVLIPFTAAVVAWNGCPGDGGAPASCEVSASHWPAVASSSAGTTCNASCPMPHTFMGIARGSVFTCWKTAAVGVESVR